MLCLQPLGLPNHLFCLSSLIDDEMVYLHPDASNPLEVIDLNRGCSNNTENIQSFAHTIADSLQACKSWCLFQKDCKAYDYFRFSNWCVAFKRACKNPLETKDGASSYRISRVRACSQMGFGTMGILGTRRKYVCNAVQAVLAHLVNESQMTFHATLVSKADHRFWRPADLARPGKKDRRMSGQSNISREDQERDRVVKDGQARMPSTIPSYTSVLPSAPRQESSRHRRRATGVPGAKSYTIPAHPRPGKRCASAKRDLGDDLLTVAAVVPISPWAFKRRQLMRELLSTPAHQLRSRQHYRKIHTLPMEKYLQPFEYFLLHDSKTADFFKGLHPKNYTSYKWTWFMKVIGRPVPEPRAVCVEIIFTVS